MLFTKYAKYSSRRFCPVCKKNGKPESEFSSHNTRDENENVICPILLSMVCNYCKEPGHIVANCPNKRTVSPRSNMFSSSSSSSSNFSGNANSPSGTSPSADANVNRSESNRFSSLSIETEETLPKPSVDDFPALRSASPRTTPVVNSYSNMASTAKVKDPENETAKKKHYSPTCEEIETRLRNLVLKLECEKEHANRFSGGTVYLTREQLRQKLSNGFDIDTDKVYLIDEYDEQYPEGDNDGEEDNANDDYDYEDD